MSCCRCNRSGSCKRCRCAKEGKACDSCLPGRLGGCKNSAPCAPPVQTNQPPDSLSSSAGPNFPSLPPSEPSMNVARPSINAPPPQAISIFTPTLTSALPSLGSILDVRVTTLHHVPKGARDAWAGILYEVFNAITMDSSDLDAWCKSFMLARCVLANPQRGGRGNWRETLKTVRARIRRWQGGDIMGLWSDVLEEEDRLTRRRKKPKKIAPDSLRIANARRARRAMEDGQYKKATQALTSDGLAQASAEVYEEMLAKHPQVNPPPTPTAPAPPPVQVAEGDIIGALRSFPNGSAPGPSSFRANHFKEAVFCPSPDRANNAIKALLGVVKLLCAGGAPPEVVPHLCGASLFACKKKGGGLRPIAVGETLRRLTSKCISRRVQAEAFQVLTPLQVGVGVPVGCEAIVHAVAHVQDDANFHPEECWTLLLDFSNAFNCVDRGSMFREVRDRIPSMAAWMESCYAAQPVLHLGEHSILSSCGVQQGDPLGPLGFALTLQPILEKIKEEVPNLLINAWYLDDGTLCGSASDLCSALAIIEEDGPARGLHLNRAKSLLYIPADDPLIHNPLPADIPTTRGGFDLLGSPIGPAPHCESTVLRRVKKVQQILANLRDLQDSQMEATLLRSCLSLPKVAFALRTSPPSHIQQATLAFDNTMLEALSDLAGGPLPEWSWLKASLPSSLGGLNIRRASLHAPAAYISSLVQSRPLVARILGRTPEVSKHLAPAFSDLVSAADRHDWHSIEDVDVPLRQRHLSHAIDEASYTHLIAGAPDTRSRALALSTAIPHAGDWLKVIPSHALGLHLHDWEFRLCLQYWLGLQMVEEGARCSICQVLADPLGDHQVGCGGNGDRIHRHDSVRDALFSAAQTAALAPRKEVPSLIPGTSSRPADVYLPNWRRGRPAALDVHIISTLQQLTLKEASVTQGHALSVGEERKRAAHAEACHAVGVTFIPMVVETLGGWSEEAALTVKNIGRLQGLRMGIPPAQAIQHLFQRLAISLWRGNATLWIRRLPTRSPEVDGLI